MLNTLTNLEPLKLQAVVWVRDNGFNVEIVDICDIKVIDYDSSYFANAHLSVREIKDRRERLRGSLQAALKQTLKGLRGRSWKHE